MIDEHVKLAAVATLQKWVNRLQAWANKPDAKPELIKEREQELIDFSTFLNQALNDYKDRYDKHEQQSRRIKWLSERVRYLEDILGARGINAGDIPHFKPDQKEILRNRSISEARTIWADHY